ncbi:WDR77 family protein [Megaselia abdita]
MDAPDYTELYAIPQDIVYPSTPNSLRQDTDFPNLNSKDYKLRKANKTEFPPYFDFIDQNSDKNVIIAANDLLHREPEGVVIGYSDVGAFEDGKDKRLFKFRREAIITGMHFMRHNLIILTLENGNVEMWSTRSDNSELNTYCPFRLTGNSQHITTVTSSNFLDANHSKLITGDLRGSVIVWDTGAADLDSVQNYSLYRSEVTGICSSNQNDNTFFSCSNHGESFISDIRTNCKGTVLTNDDENIFTDIAAQDNLIFIGDYSGNLKVFDQRNSSEEIQNLPLFGNSIKKIKPQSNGNCTALLERGVGLKIISNSTFNTIYESSEKSSLRDVIWIDESSFQVIGWNSLYKNYNLQPQNGK